MRIFCTLLTILMLGCWGQPPEGTTVPDPQPQQATHRVFKPGIFALRWSTSIAKLGIMNPVSLYVRDSRVYVLDFGTRQVKRITPYGLSQTYGYGEGQGPGEFMNPTDFKVDSLLQVWIVDAPAGRVSVFDSLGNGQKTYTFDHLPTRIAVLPSRFAILSPIPRDLHLLYLYDISGRLIKTFGQLITRPEEAMAFDGWLDSQGNSLYFAGYRVSRIVRFDASGNLQFYREMIENYPVPQVFVDERGGRRVDPQAPVAALGMNIDDRYLYVYTRSAQKHRVLDVYSPDEGNYLFSYRLPDSIRAAVMVDGDLDGIAHDTLVVQYTWQPYE